MVVVSRCARSRITHHNSLFFFLRSVSVVA
jgi:hypothetical protein